MPHCDVLYNQLQKRNINYEVCDVILMCIDDRFAFNDHLSVATLFQPDLFTQHRIVFPEAQFKTAVTLFNVNKNVLRWELLVLYAQSVKLLRIVCTIPMTTSECERCFSTLKRMETFTRNTMKEERLNALAMCSIEKNLLKRSNFNELVIDNFLRAKGMKNGFCLQTY
ncbi:hypothetical protein PR048_009029 [Dryococelus australis]|uniref:HAT C-terminal dimerisation domain-containing protein n=1 Tax=Dryococelus australis TaxID=614101 RepID=A0ABQ9HYS2_9NEOP|nr:hypothetical protein PR048_009029 [Dryococelus australis]